MFDHDFSAVEAGAESAGLNLGSASASAEALRSRLESINPDLLAPREALDLVYELRDLISDARDG